MAGNKKPKKKYIPKKMYTPNILNQMNSFSAFEEALTKLLKTGESEIDDVGILIYKTASGMVQSFESTLRVYIQILEIYALRCKVVVHTDILSVLQNRMYERKGFDEEEIEQALVCLGECKKHFASIPTVVFRDILQTVKASLAWDKLPDSPIAKNPEDVLAKYQRLCGKLTYEEVVSKSQEYQELAKENSDSTHIQELNASYMKYLFAYRMCIAERKRLSLIPTSN